MLYLQWLGLEQGQRKVLAALQSMLYRQNLVMSITRNGCFNSKSATEWLAWFNKPKFLSFPSLHQCKRTYKSLVGLIPSMDRRRQITSKHASHWPNYHHQGWSEANAHILSASRWKYSDQLVASR